MQTPTVNRQPSVSNPQSNVGFTPPANLNQIKMAMNLFQNGTNPQMLLNSLVQSNPQYSSIMNLINQHGGDAKAAFYDLAAQKGVDPNAVLNYLM